MTLTIVGLAAMIAVGSVFYRRAMEQRRRTAAAQREALQRRYEEDAKEFRAALNTLVYEYDAIINDERLKGLIDAHPAVLRKVSHG